MPLLFTSIFHQGHELSFGDVHSQSVCLNPCRDLLKVGIERFRDSSFIFVSIVDGHIIIIRVEQGHCAGQPRANIRSVLSLKYYLYR